MTQLPDSGERRKFTTGSVRDKVDGKGAFHLLSPFALRAYARRMEDGMSKYGERNWEKGQPVMTYLDSGIRHLNDFVADCMTGDEPKEDHLGAALWNIGAAIHTIEMIERGILSKTLDDRPVPPVNRGPMKTMKSSCVIGPGSDPPFVLDEIGKYDDTEDFRPENVRAEMFVESVGITKSIEEMNQETKAAMDYLESEMTFEIDGGAKHIKRVPRWKDHGPICERTHGPVLQEEDKF